MNIPTQILRIVKNNVELVNDISWSTPLNKDDHKAQAKILLYFIYTCLPYRTVEEFFKLFGGDYITYSVVAHKMIDTDNVIDA
jgi:hypothetical protein